MKRIEAKYGLHTLSCPGDAMSKPFTMLLFTGVLLIMALEIIAQGAGTSLSSQLLPRYDIPRLEHILIDGQANDWGDNGFRVDALTPIAGKLRSVDDFRASLRLGWNEQGLLVLVSVDDARWIESPDIDKLFERDSIELYLAPYRGATDSCQWVIAMGMTDDQPEVRCKFYDHRRSKILADIPGTPQYARSNTDSGCLLEMLLPWTALGITARVGREVAFQLMTNTVEEENQELYHASWYPAIGAAFTSMKMHRLRLAETPGPPVAGRLNLLSSTGEGLTFRALAPAALAGKAVAISGAETILATGVLQLDDSGYAQALLTAPPPAPLPYYDRIDLLLDNNRVDSLVLHPGQDDFPSRLLTLGATATIEKSPSSITITWPMEDDDTGTTVIARSIVGSPTKKRRAMVHGNHYRDSAIRTGTLYEYALAHESPTFPSTSYLYAGRAVRLDEERGTLLLIVEQRVDVALADEIARLTRDLIGDGWKVTRHVVSSDESVVAVKEWILRERKTDPGVESVLLLGHVPVPYSGRIRPDGHDDHRGAWPADGYYGDIGGEWTDTQDLKPDGEERLRNVAGDGKFDQSTFPGQVELAVGRVDLSHMPAFEQDEIALLRQYLDRNHAYRHKQFAVKPAGLINDGFKERSDAFSYGGWQSFSTLLGAENITEGHWFAPGENSYAFMYSCGPGSYTGGGGLGSTAELSKSPVYGIFTPIFGSYFADWDTPDNLMRALLCNAGYPLASFWSGRPHWYLHPMGMGKTIGYCARLTQNNAGEYSPTGSASRGIHIALMGDPTLRLHIVAPPATLVVHASQRGGMQLTWMPSSEQVVGYHLYRAAGEFGPFTRVNSKPIGSTSYSDRKGRPGDWYMVRALALQDTPGGTYYNASQGIFARATLEP